MGPLREKREKWQENSRKMTYERERETMKGSELKTTNRKVWDN